MGDKGPSDGRLALGPPAPGSCPWPVASPSSLPLLHLQLELLPREILALSVCPRPPWLLVYIFVCLHLLKVLTARSSGALSEDNSCNQPRLLEILKLQCQGDPGTTAGLVGRPGVPPRKWDSEGTGGQGPQGLRVCAHRPEHHGPTRAMLPLSGPHVIWLSLRTTPAVTGELITFSK